jgi:hypothetical protein
MTTAVVGVYAVRRRGCAGLRTASRSMLRRLLPLVGGGVALASVAAADTEEFLPPPSRGGHG